jgi:hypothetical protein
MASTGPATIVCPACRQPIELPTRLISEQGSRTATLAVDLQPATDHALTHQDTPWTPPAATPAPSQ